MLALTRAPTAGWTSIGSLSLFAASIVAGLLFALSERRSSHPLLDRSQLRRPGIVAANVVGLLSTAVMCNLFFFLSLYFQNVRGLTSLGAAGMLLPLTALIVVLSPLAGHVSDRVGRRPLVIAGLVTLATALVVLSRIAVDTPLALLLFALAITGAGIGLATAPTTAAALDGIPDHHVGQASAVLNTSRALGLSFGIAIMGALLSAGPTNVVNATATTRQAFVHGLTNGLTLNAGIALLAAAIALRALPHSSRPRAKRPPSEDARRARAVAVPAPAATATATGSR